MALSAQAKQNPGIQALPSAKDYVVSKFHTPRVAIIIPHYNYSEFIGDALLSVQQQTYTNFTCVIVDDCSTEAHFSVVSQEVAKLADDRFKLVRNVENRGQISSVYRGIEETDPIFLTILDPDDRYAPEFIARMLAVHLNPLIFCPLVSCDQYLLKLGDGAITATQLTNGFDLLNHEVSAREQELFAEYGFHKFVAPTEHGWHWTTTSSMMFRVDALRLITPVKLLSYKGHCDAYCANGAHMMGGSLLLREALVYRGLHDRNDFISNTVFSMFQRQEKPDAIFMSDTIKIDVIAAFLENGGMEYFSLANVQELITAQFRGTEFAKLLAAVPRVAEILGK